MVTVKPSPCARLGVQGGVLFYGNGNPHMKTHS